MPRRCSIPDPGDALMDGCCENSDATPRYKRPHSTPPTFCPILEDAVQKNGFNHDAIGTGQPHLAISEVVRSLPWAVCLGNVGCSFLATEDYHVRLVVFRGRFFTKRPSTSAHRGAIAYSADCKHRRGSRAVDGIVGLRTSPDRPLSWDAELQVSRRAVVAAGAIIPPAITNAGSQGIPHFTHSPASSRHQYGECPPAPHSRTDITFRPKKPPRKNIASGRSCRLGQT